jgi:GNAT superfamily N-acetyltransferase
MIHYEINKPITPNQFVDILIRSMLAERRPVDDRETIAGMLQHGDLLVTAWNDDTLIGVSRSVTDFHYCCYLSDLAVDQDFQAKGIGRELIRLTRAQLGPRCNLILLSAPAATGYYPRIGFTQHNSAWVMFPDDNLK